MHGKVIGFRVSFETAEFFEPIRLSTALLLMILPVFKSASNILDLFANGGMGTNTAQRY